MDEEKKRKYEITFITKEESSPVKAILEKRSAEIIDERPLEKIRLAYPINKQNFGFLGTIVFLLDPEAVQMLAPDLKLEQGLVRHLVTALTVERQAAESQRKSARVAAALRRKTAKEVKPGLLTNEALEKKIEEILQ